MLTQRATKEDKKGALDALIAFLEKTFGVNLNGLQEVAEKGAQATEDADKSAENSETLDEDGELLKEAKTGYAAAVEKRETAIDTKKNRASKV